jgi:hypothetical protein
MLERLRGPRVFGISGFDFIGTLVGAWLLSLVFKWDLGLTILVLLVLGEIAHCARKIDTPITRHICPHSIS